MTTLFSGVEYTGQTFTRLAGREQRISEVEFSECVFDACDFGAATFYRCTFLDCRFTTCDLGLASVPNSRFTDVQFTGCKLLGVDWTQAGDGATSLLPLALRFTDCTLNFATFFGLPLKGLTLTRCTAHEVDFTEADLTGADLRGSDFARSKFARTNLTRADLRGALNYAIDPTITTVKKAKFSLPEAVALLRVFGVVVE